MQKVKISNKVKMRLCISSGGSGGGAQQAHAPGGALTFEKGRGVRPQNLKPYP